MCERLSRARPVSQEDDALICSSINPNTVTAVLSHLLHLRAMYDIIYHLRATFEMIYHSRAIIVHLNPAYMNRIRLFKVLAR